MVQAVLSVPVGRFSFPAVEAFPISLSALHLAGFESHLDSETLSKLRRIEQELLQTIDYESILQARTDQDLKKALESAFKKAAEYYVESGIIVWRALNHDYTRLLVLSEESCRAVESAFFRHCAKLDIVTLIKAVAGIRVLGKVGQWVIKAEGKEVAEERLQPIVFLAEVALATFFTSCLLMYVKGQVKKARPKILRELAKGVITIAEVTYKKAIGEKLYEVTDTENHWYWSPAWQEGEVEADLNILRKKLKSFGSTHELITDLEK